MDANATSTALRSERLFRSISYGLMFLMIVCIIMALGRLLHNFLPDWHSGVITGVMLLILIDRIFLHQRLKTASTYSTEWAVIFGTQWIVFVVFIRLLLSYANGLEAFMVDLARFTQGRIEELLNPEFIVTLLLAALAWYLPALFLDLLDEIGLNQILVLGAEPSFVQSDAVAAHRRLVSLIFSLGIVLVLLTALARVDLYAALSNTAGSPPGEAGRLSSGEGGVLLYFILGLALLAQSRLMSLQTSWNVQRIPISSDTLVRQWGIYSLIFLFAIVLVVGLLPTGDSLGIFSLLTTLLNFLTTVLFFLWRFLVGLLILLFSLPFLLFGKAPPLETQILEQPVLPPQILEPLSPAESNPNWILIRSILLWSALLVIVFFSLRQFIRQHGDLKTALRKAPVIHWLVLVWQWLRKNVESTRVGLSQAITDGWQNLVARLEARRILSRPGWISLRGLDPRRRVYFFYLAMIRRGAEQGLPRKSSQTPTEYAATLEKSLPSAGEDIDLITREFMEARYSRREIDIAKANIVKATWERIRRALQERFKVESARKR